LELNPGVPFSLSDQSQTSIDTQNEGRQLSSYSFPIVRGMAALVFFALVVYVLVRVFALMDKKLFVQLILVSLALILVGSILPSLPQGQAPSFPNLAPERKVVPTSEVAAPIGEPPQMLIRFVVIGLIVGFVLLVIYLFWRSGGSHRSRGELLKEAEEAALALQSGLDLRSVIMRCYYQMSEILKEEKGVERSDDMTPQEFQSLLINRGLPAEPVRRLTSIFQKMRYSGQAASHQDEVDASNSLYQLIKYFGEIKD